VTTAHLTSTDLTSTETGAAVVDKAAATLGRTQYHLRVGPADLQPDPGLPPPAMLLPGDPDRVGRIARVLDDAREVAYHREYRSMVGSRDGIPVGACSTGIGCPSAAIAAEELINCGVTTLIRVGSTASLQPHIATGDLIVSTGAMKNEGTSRMYVPDSFPAVPDLELTVALVAAAREVGAQRGLGVHVGIGASDDAFYAETPEQIARMSALGLLNVEMEASALYTVGYLRGVRTGMVCAVSGNLVTNDVVYEGVNERLVNGWEAAIEVAIRAAVALRG
jgi:uridine phosphorylase